jgi:hypothetical protein
MVMVMVMVKVVVMVRKGLELTAGFCTCRLLRWSYKGVSCVLDQLLACQPTLDIRRFGVSIQDIQCCASDMPRPESVE